MFFCLSRTRAWLYPVILVLALFARAGYAADEQSVKALWVWGSEEVLGLSAQERLLGFAQANGVNRLYVGVWKALVNQPQRLAEFVRTCRSRGIGVEFLFGERDWAFARNHHHALKVVERVLDYSIAFPDAAPSAIHLDVEPYILPQWKTAKNRIASEMVDLFEKVRARMAGSGLALVVDIPRWFDEHPITRGSETRPLHEWIIDATDGVVLMNYQDNYAQLIQGAEDELRYAAKVNKPVIVGVETLCIEPKSITFCEEGRNVMEGMLVRLNNDMKKRFPSYRGHAVHHLDSYLALKP